MPKAWTVLTGADLWEVVPREVIEKTDEDAVGGTHEDGDFDSSLDSRAKKAVDHAVAEVRGAIESAQRWPLSVTAGAVPPELVLPTLALAAYRLITVKPSLLAVVMNDGGVYSPLGKLYKEGCDWLAKLRTGANFTAPTDPTGVDYLTAVSADNPAISGISWGDSLANDIEYDAGVTEDGIVVSTLTNNMNTQ